MERVCRKFFLFFLFFCVRSDYIIVAWEIEEIEEIEEVDITNEFVVNVDSEVIELSEVLFKMFPNDNEKFNLLYGELGESEKDSNYRKNLKRIEEKKLESEAGKAFSEVDPEIVCNIMKSSTYEPEQLINFIVQVAPMLVNLKETLKDKKVLEEIVKNERFISLLNFVQKKFGNKLLDQVSNLLLKVAGRLKDVSDEDIEAYFGLITDNFKAIMQNYRVDDVMNEINDKFKNNQNVINFISSFKEDFSRFRESINDDQGKEAVIEIFKELANQYNQHYLIPVKNTTLYPNLTKDIKAVPRGFKKKMENGVEKCVEIYRRSCSRQKENRERG